MIIFLLSLLSISDITSISNPVTTSPSLNENGGNSALVPTITVSNGWAVIIVFSALYQTMKEVIIKIVTIIYKDFFAIESLFSPIFRFLGMGAPNKIWGRVKYYLCMICYNLIK